MIQQIRTIVDRIYPKFNVLLFRSAYLKVTNIAKQEKKMVQTLTVEELKQRSAQAQELIEKLQKQIQQIKVQTSPASVSDKVTLLQKENEQLRTEVEKLKKELENAERNQPLQSVTSQATKTEAKKSEGKQKPAKQAENKPKQESKKTPAPVDEKVDFSKLDVRVGKIVEVGKHPDADSLYVEKIDLGEGGKLRNVCSGLVKHIPIEEMQNKMVVVLCNLKPTKLRGVLSEAMVLCASTPEKVELLVPPGNAQVGDRISVEGFIGQPAPEINPKNNIFGLVQVDLKTDDNLNASYQGKVWQVSGKGPVTTSTLKNVPIK